MIPFIFALLIGALTGALTGAGIGGGTLLVLYLQAVQGVSLMQSRMTNLIYFAICAPLALVSHIKNGLVELKGGAVAAASGAIAALLCCLAFKEAGPWLQTAAGVLFILIGIKELFTKNPDKTAE